MITLYVNDKRRMKIFYIITYCLHYYNCVLTAIAEVAGNAGHSSRLYSTDIHGAPKTPSNTVSKLFISCTNASYFGLPAIAII